MKNLDDALNLLKQHEFENQSIINFAESNPVYSAVIRGNSVLVRGISDQNWVYISSRDKHELLILNTQDITSEDKFFAAIEDWMVKHIIENRNVVWDVATVRYTLLDSVELPKVTQNVLPLSPTDAEKIHKHSIYKEYITPVFIKDRICRGYSAGIYDNDNLVAWGLTQDDGAVGFLYVDEKYRKLGYGKDIAVSLFQKVRQDGKQPFLYVEESNKISTNMVLRLAFQKEKKVHWLCLE